MMINVVEPEKGSTQWGLQAAVLPLGNGSFFLRDVSIAGIVKKLVLRIYRLERHVLVEHLVGDTISHCHIHENPVSPSRA